MKVLSTVAAMALASCGQAPGASAAPQGGAVKAYEVAGVRVRMKPDEAGAVLQRAGYRMTGRDTTYAHTFAERVALTLSDGRTRIPGTGTAQQTWKKDRETVFVTYAQAPSGPFVQKAVYSVPNDSFNAAEGVAEMRRRHGPPSTDAGQNMVGRTVTGWCTLRAGKCDPARPQLGVSDGFSSVTIFIDGGKAIQAEIDAAFDAAVRERRAKPAF